MFNCFVRLATHKFGQQAAAGLLTGLCFSISATAQIGTTQERDIGIRNQQELQRQRQQEQQQRQQLGTGNLSVTADALTNLRGQVFSNQNATLQLSSLDNTQGSVYAHTDLSLATTGAITNTGFIAAQGNTSITANSLNSTSASVVGAGIKADGTVANSGDLKITTIQVLNANGQNLAPLIEACQKAGRNNCKGEVIAQQFAEANGFGAESMKRESNAGTLGSPFSFNNCPSSDKGGCSYGPLQIAADTGMMKGFMDGLRSNPSEEAQSFYKELQAAGGVTASQNKDPAFIQTWMKLTAKDPQFVQYQIDALVNQNLYPVVQELQKAGIDFNSLSQSQKEALFSAAVQHGAGTISKTKGADNVLERSMSVAQTDAKAPSFPTYTRQELVYGQVEDQMRFAEEAQAKLITQRESLITQQLQLERQKSQLLEQGLNSDATQVQSIKNQAAVLDIKINDITGKVDSVTQKVNAQNQYIEDARQYLKSQAQGSLADGEQWLKDFYQQRTQMYPAEASRYKKELDSLLKQYREEQLNKGAK